MKEHTYVSFDTVKEAKEHLTDEYIREMIDDETIIELGVANILAKYNEVIFPYLKIAASISFDPRGVAEISGTFDPKIPGAVVPLNELSQQLIDIKEELLEKEELTQEIKNDLQRMISDEIIITMDKTDDLDYRTQFIVQYEVKVPKEDLKV
jgi:hypothetical protein